MITKQEMTQLNAFARYDGLKVGALMAVTFILMMRSLTFPMLELIAMFLLVATPFYVAKRVMAYRDTVVMKRVSYRRALYYAMQCFMYGGLVLAAVAYIYMRFFDGGVLFNSLSESLSRPEMQEVIKQNGMAPDELLQLVGGQKPIDISVSLLSNVLIMGFIASAIIALVVGREPKKVNN